MGFCDDDDLGVLLIRFYREKQEKNMPRERNRENSQSSESGSSCAAVDNSICFGNDFGQQLSIRKARDFRFFSPFFAERVESERRHIPHHHLQSPL